MAVSFILGTRLEIGSSNYVDKLLFLRFALEEVLSRMLAGGYASRGHTG